jgi:hypothetical protein
MTPVTDDTEAVPWEFLKSPIKEKHFNAPNSTAHGKHRTLSGLKAHAKCLIRKLATA